METDVLKNRISVRGLKVWRITGALHSLFLLGIWGIGALLVNLFDWPKWPLFASGIAIFCLMILLVTMIPSIRWKRWRYEVRDQEIELQHGVLIVTRTLVPIVRVQHVDMVQGPILRKYDLATVKISTAATMHEIPAVDIMEAAKLRHAISALARVNIEDV